MDVARQMWCLGKFLLLIIGSLVPSDDERWLNFSLLLKIVDIVFSSVASANDLGILEGYIEEYLWQFTCIYPVRSVIPKMHYLVHYPAHIFKFGPMVHSWCMRYEAKHSYFKRLAAYMGNFTNVALSLGERHQTRSCYLMSAQCGGSANPLAKKPKIESGKQVVSGDSEYFEELRERESTPAETDVLQKQRKISIHGTEYRVGVVVHVGSLDDLPVFASIQEMYVYAADNIYFLLKRFMTTTFSSQFHSYDVRRPADEQVFVFKPTMLKMYLPMHTVKASSCKNGVLYVTPRYLPPQTEI